MAKAARTAAGLREVLFDQIDRLRSGEIEPDEAKATATLAKEIVNLTRLEIEVHREMNKDDALLDDFTTGELHLGKRTRLEAPKPENDSGD